MEMKVERATNIGVCSGGRGEKNLEAAGVAMQSAGGEREAASTTWRLPVVDMESPEASTVLAKVSQQKINTGSLD